MTQAADADAFVDSLVGELTRHPVNSNRFFQTFLSQRLTKSQLQEWLGQYHYFCKQFVKVLEGLLSRTPVDELEMRVQLVKTLHSELGNGRSEQAHIRLLERFAAAAGLNETDLQRISPLPEVAEYLAVLRRLFIEDDYLAALGAELAVEVTAAAEFRYFYPGLLRYDQFSAEDLVFFELHLEAEDDHGLWLADAVRKTAQSSADLNRVATGARTAVEAWQSFWEGVYRGVFSEHNPIAIPWNN
jgi:pyrroloquinoline quinone (PQQ) biosynthesis protein C